MKILRILPKLKINLNQAQALTYFSKENIEVGGVVYIKIRKRRIIGLVVDSIDLKEAKMMLRKGEKFSLKPIEKVLSPLSIFDNNIIDLIHWTSQYYFEPEGIVLKNVLPDVSQKKWKELEIDKIIEIRNKNIGPKNKKQLKQILLKDDMSVTEKKFENIRQYYNNLDKKKFKKFLTNSLKEKKQCLVLYSEIAKLKIESEYWNHIFRENERVVVFHSELTKNEFWENWKRVLSGESLIILATRQGAFLPFLKLGLIIIQDESSFSHKSWDQHPKYNAKHVALKLSEIHESKVVFNDPTPSFESYLNIKNKKYELITSEKQEDNRSGIIDMGQMIDSKMKFSYISPRLKTEIQNTIDQKGKILLFQNRRGLATYIFCKDCGYYYSCPNCNFSLVHHKTKDKLVCHWCNHKEYPPKACRKCTGETIKYSGHGTQKILEEASELFPGTKITILDYDNAPTTDDRLKIYKEFINSDMSGIMIATSIILSISEISFDFSAVLNYDLLVNFPDYQTNERIARLIKKLRISTKKLYLQSYNVKDPLLLNLARGNTEGIYKKELMLRQDLHYPPYWQFAALKLSHKYETIVEKEAKKLYDLLTDKNSDNKSIEILGPLLPIKARTKGRFSRSIIIKNKKGNLNQRNKLLLKVPSKWEIDVDPIDA
jgi:primosomal protein N' (replication factor Y) (superfamily II helicase)